MAFKAVFLIFASTLLVQSLAGSICGCSSSSRSVSVSSSGGDLEVTAIGSISPSDISVSSDIDLSGDLDVCGELPFLSAVEFSGEYNTRGSADVDYSCGSSNNVAITSIIGSSDSGSGSGCGCGK